ncbi:MAG: MATE family efflux transporter [Clostridia bacterium]|nr:MATE family efflux transporter [Clostridia bacterium]
MAGTRSMDMTQGPIARQLISFAVPMLIGLIFQQLYNTVDTIVVGNFVSAQALAAVGTTGPLINTLLGFFNGFSAGATVVIARAFGARNPKDVQNAVHTTIAMTLILAAVITAAGLLLTPTLLRLMRAPEDMVPEATTYLRIYFMGISGLMLYNMGAGILRAVGDSRRPLYFLIFSAVINTAGDLILVLVFHLGVAGVAYATILAQGLSALLVLYVLMQDDGIYRLRFRRLRIHGATLKRIISIGLPTALQSAITAFSNVFVQSYINVFGSSCAAGWSMYGKLDQFALLPLQSISMANATFVGQNLGALDIPRAKRGIRTALLTGMGCTAVLMAPLMLFAEPLLRLFNQQPEVLYYGRLFVLWISPFYLFACVNDILGGALRGAGESLATMICMLMSFVVIRQIYLYVMSTLTSSAVLTGLGYPLGWILCSIALSLCYKLIPWEEKQRARQAS